MIGRHVRAGLEVSGTAGAIKAVGSGQSHETGWGFCRLNYFCIIMAGWSDRQIETSVNTAEHDNRPSTVLAPAPCTLLYHTLLYLN